MAACVPASLSTVKNTDAGRSAHLVARECIELTTELLHIDLGMRNSLCTINQNRYIPVMGSPDDRFYGIYGAQSVGHLCQG